MDYSKVDSDELKEEIYHRQMMGIPDVMPRISRISCRCCHEPIMSVALHWKDHYKPREALPCLMCGHQPILTAACSWVGGYGKEWNTYVSYWIECKCGPKQEFSADKLVPHPAYIGRTSSITSQYRILRYNLSMNGTECSGTRSKPANCN
jgi:hypothetical protein